MRFVLALIMILGFATSLVALAQDSEQTAAVVNWPSKDRFVDERLSDDDMKKLVDQVLGEDPANPVQTAQDLTPVAQ
jgi:hypothetical protein